LDIKDSYISRGGEFLVAIENGAVIGTIAFMNYGDHNAVLKKFFVQAEYRSQGIGLALYKKLLGVLVEQGYKKVLLDTPAVAVKSHHFYEKAGFKMISKQELPFHYEYPDRDSLLYLLVL
jgi:predicted N-acetyltransferase YhbS